MNTDRIITEKQITVSGMTLTRQSDGNYTANIVREESIAGVISTRISDEEDKWEHKIEKVKWDLRVGQEWLNQHPDKWAAK
jgi:hypothetical protein